MTRSNSLPDKIRRGAPIPWYLDAALRAATPLFQAGMALRRLRSPVAVNARVVSYGNLTAGGTGKTPAVIERAETEASQGHTVGILTRGYGASQQAGPLLVLGAKDAISRWQDVGDEPALIASKVPDCVIARCADRVRGARVAIEAFHCDVLILDDGFQWVRLARDENVVVLDATNPFGNGYLLPRGVLREPISALNRATHIVLTHCDAAAPDSVESALAAIRLHCPSAPVRTTRHAPHALRNLVSGESVGLDVLRGADIVATCAIAQPERFAATLASLGANIAEQRAYSDHAAIPKDALRSENLVVVTEKDAVRIQGAPPNVFALEIRLRDCAIAGT